MILNAHECSVKLSTAFIKYVFTIKNHAFFKLAALQSTGVTYIVKILKITEQNQRDMVILLFAQMMLLGLFYILSITDFVSGYQAALYRNSKRKQPQTKSEVFSNVKVWRTFWKGFGITIITFVLVAVAFVAELLESRTIFLMSVWFILLFWVMATGFEFYSIGQNLAKMKDGEKPQVFMFFDRMLNVLEKSIFRRIFKVVGGDENPNENQENL